MAMQRARRLAFVAVVATLAVNGLAACRSAPDVAVYFGRSAAVTVADVQRVYDDARSKLAAARNAAQRGQDTGASAPADASVELPITRPEVVSALVGHDLVTRVARQRAVKLPAQLPLEQAAASIGMPPDAEYVRLYTETRLLFNQLMQNASPVPTSDRDLREVFRALEGAKALPPGTTYEQFQPQVAPEAMQTLGRAVAVRNDVQAQVDQLDLRLNPRFSPAKIDIYVEPGPNNKTLPLVSLPLADANTSPVIDPA